MPVRCFFLQMHHYVAPQKGCRLLLFTCFIGGHLIYKTCGPHVVTTFIGYYVFNDFCQTAAITLELFIKLNYLEQMETD